MPRIPEDLVDRVKLEVDVASLVSRSGVELKRVGENLVGCCNRHEDETPSLVVTPAKGLFHCMGACQKGGSVIDWVMWQQDLGFHQATMKLIEEFFPEEARALAQARPSRRFRAEPLPCPFDENASDEELSHQVITYYHETLKHSPAARAYFEKRGIVSEEVIARFKLGFANRTLGFHIRTRKLKQRFQALGYVRPLTGREHMNGSVTVPIFGEGGEVVGCYGRKITPNLRSGTPKHLYTHGRHRSIFNRTALTESKEILLCEAPLDMLSAVESGFPNAVSCFGVEGFTDEHLDLFTHHGIQKVLIAFDRDGAGDSGARKVADRLLPRGIDCFRVLLPKGMDVNDVTRTMHPAAKTLDFFFRSAEWMGNGRRPVHATIALERVHELVVPEEAANALPSAASAAPVPTIEPDAVVTAGIAAEKKIEPAAEEGTPTQAPASQRAPVTAATTPGLIKLLDDEAELLFEDRRYKVRGLRKCLGYGALRVTLKAEREGLDLAPPSPISGWHLDTLDLCSYRSRAGFEREAARELGVKEEVVRFDIGRIVRVLESVQEERIEKATAPKTKTVTLTEKDTAEALALLKSPDLLSRIVSDLTRCGLVGEETNKLVCYVAAVSRLLDRPLAVIIQSSSAAGKTSLMEAVLSMLPEESREKYTAVSGKSLFYFDEDVSLSHKVLAIVEEEGAERATYPLKILQSEGELVMASTGKDPHTGKLVTKIYRVKGPVVIILATTAYELDPELENRCLRLTVDESREQTRRIHELQRAAQSVEGLVARKDAEKIRKLHRNAQRLLRPLHVINPYEKELTFIDDQTRTRRDHDKYLTLIASIALLHQYQREIKRVTAGDDSIECIEVELEDIEIANRLAGEILGRTLDELQPQTRRFLTLLHGHVARISESGVDQCDFRFTRKDVRGWTGWSQTQVGIHLSRLVDLEYVLQHRGSRGQSFVYELLWKGEGLDDRPFVLGLVDVETLRKKGEASTTTPTSRSCEGEKTGLKRGQNGGETAGSRPIETATSPNISAAFPLSAAESSENALIPPAGKTRSYVLRRTHRAPCFNLLRFPPGSTTPRPSRARLVLAG
jgi:DNA primase catalytic core